MPELELADARIHYYRAGEGPAVLLVQGAGVCGCGWAAQVDDLQKDFRCISLDNRGIGRSINRTSTLTIPQMADDTWALADHLGERTVHLVGHSMGGLIAQEMAFRHPERVRSLSLLCTFARGPQASGLSVRVVWLGLRLRIGTRGMRRRAFLSMLFSREFLAHADKEALADRVERTIGRDFAESPPIIDQQLRAMRAYDRSEELHKLAAIPTLVTASTEDLIARPKYGRELSERIPGSRFLEIPGSSHGVIIELSDRVNQLLREQFQIAGRVPNQGSGS